MHNPTQNLVTFIRDESKNWVTTKFDYRFVFSDKSDSGTQEASDFKKVFYMIFSNSLLRLKANMHLFHHLISFPNLSVEKLMLRNWGQLTISNGTDRVQPSKSESLLTQSETNGDSEKGQTEMVKLRLPFHPDSHIFNIFGTNVGVHEGVNKQDPLTFLGKGGFGEVKMANLYNK